MSCNKPVKSIIIASDPGDLTLSIILQLISDPQDLTLRYVKVIVSDPAILLVVVVVLNFFVRYIMTHSTIVVVLTHCMDAIRGFYAV